MQCLNMVSMIRYGARYVACCWFYVNVLGLFCWFKGLLHSTVTDLFQLLFLTVMQTEWLNELHNFADNDNFPTLKTKNILWCSINFRR